MAKNAAMWKKTVPKILLIAGIAVLAFLAFRKGGWLNKGTKLTTSPSTNTAGSATNPGTSVANGSRTESELTNVARSFAFVGGN